jgi:hypothetical protein
MEDIENVERHHQHLLEFFVNPGQQPVGADGLARLPLREHLRLV